MGKVNINKSLSILVVLFLFIGLSGCIASIEQNVSLVSYDRSYDAELDETTITAIVKIDNSNSIQDIEHIVIPFTVSKEGLEPDYSYIDQNVFVPYKEIKEVVIEFTEEGFVDLVTVEGYAVLLYKNIFSTYQPFIQTSIYISIGLIVTVALIIFIADIKIKSAGKISGLMILAVILLVFISTITNLPKLLLNLNWFETAIVHTEIIIITLLVMPILSAKQVKDSKNNS